MLVTGHRGNRYFGTEYGTVGTSEIVRRPSDSFLMNAAISALRELDLEVIQEDDTVRIRLNK